VLEALGKPVKIDVLMAKNDPFYHRMHALLDNCRSVNPNIQVKYLSPDLDQEEVGRLAKEYKFVGERLGVLILYGSGDKVENRFIKGRDLISENAEMTGRNKQPLFKGEIAIVSELNSLAFGEEKPAIYFTQGDGEPDLADMQRGRIGDGLGSLKERLQASNYTVKGLQFSPATGVKAKNPDVVVAKTVPDDASLVVIVAPHGKFEKFALDALRKYMEPPDPKVTKGKLIVYMDVVLTPEKTMEMTGLEPFLGEFGVQVNNNRILTIPGGVSSDPQLVLAYMNPDQQRNEIVATFARRGCPLYNISRTVEPKPAGPQSNPRYHPELMMIVPLDQRQVAWAETNLQTDPITLIKEYDRKGELEKKLGQGDLPVAVSVTENIPGAVGGPHAMMQGEEKPRLIVFGNGSLVSNRLVDKATPIAFPYYELFTSCVAWLRERPTSIGIEPKKSDYYAFPLDANVTRMVVLPSILMVVGIIGLGTGVWVVRRR
jgi:hypothetical protein